MLPPSSFSLSLPLVQRCLIRFSRFGCRPSDQQLSLILNQVINPSAYPIATSLLPPERRATAVAVRISCSGRQCRLPFHKVSEACSSSNYEYSELVQLVTSLQVLESCYGLGLMFGPPLGGCLYSIAGFFLPFWFSGVSFLSSHNPKHVKASPNNDSHDRFIGSYF